MNCQEKNEVMFRVPQSPRIVMTWGLMFLTVISGGVRPSCICPDGTLCLNCPKQLAASSASPLPQPAATGGSCSSKSCCREHASTAVRHESTLPFELAALACDGRDCLAIQAASPAIVQAGDDSTSRINSAVVPGIVEIEKPAPLCQSFHPTGSTHRAGPPPDLIVLFQRWLI